MSLARAALAALALFAAGCASVEETTVQSAPEAAPPPKVAVVQPAPREVTPAPGPEPEAPPVAPQPSRASQVETLIAEYARLRRLPGAELVREQEDARREFNQTRSDSARIRLAMALAVPGSPAGDEARALELLDPLVKTPGASLHALAFLLSSYLHDQRRLTAQVNGLQQNVQGLQQNVQGLQQKLDAIKSLERSLSGRGEAARRK